MERPISIVWFERCYLGCVAVGLVNTALQWPKMMAQLAENPGTAQLGGGMSIIMIGTMLLSIAISLLLWYFAARKAAVVAKWIITVFFVISLLGIGFSAMTGTFPTGISGILGVVALVLNAIAVWNLFRPDAEAWFGGAATIDSASRL